MPGDQGQQSLIEKGRILEARPKTSGLGEGLLIDGGADANPWHGIIMP